MLVMRISRAGLPDFAKRLVAALPHKAGERAYVVGLSGELGAGKTAFVQEVAKTLGVTVPVTSPTFVLAQPYPIHHAPFSRLVHIDAYRLDAGHKDTLGWREYAADPRNLVLVEWPERLPGGIPEGTRVLTFTVAGDDARDITETHV
jgi:tRNA threonylcarbamoyladenosine biosynthesis protein TsaE